MIVVCTIVVCMIVCGVEVNNNIAETMLSYADIAHQTRRLFSFHVFVICTQYQQININKCD